MPVPNVPALQLMPVPNVFPNVPVSPTCLPESGPSPNFVKSGNIRRGPFVDSESFATKPDAFFQGIIDNDGEFWFTYTCTHIRDPDA